VAFLAWNAWRGKDGYRLGEIRKWLTVFLERFFQTSQFKRSALPNGPKVGSGGSLSPRGDWRAPSDGVADAWLAELARVPARE
jgi:NAD+ synthase (glutamine-hydrolysing)